MNSARHSFRLTREKIKTRLHLIAPMVFRNSMALEPFRILPLDGAYQDAPICADPSNWDIIEPGSYWGAPDLNFVMKSGFVVPGDWNTDQLALHLPLGVLGDIFNHPEALTYIDQAPIGSADRYHHTLPLSPDLADGRRHVVSLHGWTGHAGWPPDPNSNAKLHMGHCALVERAPETQAFVTLASVALDALTVIDTPEIAEAILTTLDQAFLALDTRDPLGAAFYDTVPTALQVLKDGLASSGAPMDVTLHGIGHAHMDIAYLWPISQIRLKNARTYSNVLRLLEEDESFHFSHSQPALYEMTAEDYPDMFRRIKSRVAEGRWEVMGGMWVEADLNIPGPEALIRQMTLGRSYFRDTFGDVETPALWLPDTFGFPGQIPQLMRLAGLDWFVTNKLNWNQFNRVPWATHLWEGIDGSRVKAHILTTPRDVQYLPFPTNYKSDLTAKEVMGTVTHAGGGASKDLPICFGYGDGGGGPTEELLAKARAYAAFPGMPRIRMGTVRDTLSALDANSGELPVWRGEHYLEGHRGVYTSQAWIKRANRQAERALHLSEALNAMARTQCDLTEAWKLLCLTQFHDIVTGTSVPEVYHDARRDFDKIAGLTTTAVDQAAKVLAGPETSVANVLPTAGPRTVVVPAETAIDGQPTESGKLLHFPKLAPYSVTPLCAAARPDAPVKVTASANTIVLENAFLSATFEDGQLTSLIENETRREVIAPDAIANRFLAFEDRPICWDAWDIDPHYEDREDALGPPQSVEIVETGPLRARLRLEYAWRQSRIVQDVILNADMRRLDFRTEVDWHQTHTLLKVAFPVTVSAPEAMFDIQWGTIARSTDRSSEFDAARFEVPAQKWASLADETLDVALMNDCKYGFDVRKNVLRQTLIKSATSPDPNADQGHHAFTYAIFAAPPHRLQAKNHAAYELNQAPLLLEGNGANRQTGHSMVEVDADNIVIETLKPCDQQDGIVVRLFECSGRRTECTMTIGDTYNSAHEADIFEVAQKPLPLDGQNVSLTVEPYQILSLMFLR